MGGSMSAAAHERRPVGKLTGVAYEHPGAFWFGVTAVTAGVLLMLPMFFSARHDQYHLAGKSMDAPMWIGMILTMVGIAATAYGLIPRLSRISQGAVSRIRVRALDDAPIRPAHVALLLVMAAAVTIDVMKPTTLAFVVPGMGREYGLRTPPTPTASVPGAWLPLSGISGPALGSFLWGWFGD